MMTWICPLGGAVTWPPRERRVCSCLSSLISAKEGKAGSSCFTTACSSHTVLEVHVHPCFIRCVVLEN